MKGSSRDFAFIVDNLLFFEYLVFAPTRVPSTTMALAKGARYEEMLLFDFPGGRSEMITGIPEGVVPPVLMAGANRERGMIALGHDVFIDDHGVASVAYGTIVHITSDGRKVYRDPYAFLRGARHIRAYYAAAMGQIVEALLTVQAALTQTWFVEYFGTDQIAYYKMLVDQAIDSLEGRNHVFLESAQEILERASDLNDSLGRFNPFSRAAMLCAVLRRLDWWAKHAQQQVDEVSLAERAVLNEHQRVMFILQSVHLGLTEMSRWWMSDRRVKDADHARRLTRRVQVCHDLLDQIVAQPFRPLAYRTRHDLRLVIADLQSGKHEDAWAHFERALRALRLPQVFSRVHEVVTALSLAHRWGESQMADLELQAAVLVIRSAEADLKQIPDDDFVTRVVGHMQGCLFAARRELDVGGDRRLIIAKQTLLDAVDLDKARRAS